MFQTRQQALGTNSFRDVTLRAYQATAPGSISFFTGISWGAHGLVSTNELALFYSSFLWKWMYISVKVDKGTIFYFVFASFNVIGLREEQICWTYNIQPHNSSFVVPWIITSVT